jgi:hypothetical protein
MEAFPKPQIAGNAWILQNYNNFFVICKGIGNVYALLLGASGASAGPGFPLQFLGFAHCKSCGISASIPCAD